MTAVCRIEYLFICVVRLEFNSRRLTAEWLRTFLSNNIPQFHSLFFLVIQNKWRNITQFSRWIN